MKVRTSLKSLPIWIRWGTPGLSALLGILVLLGVSGVWLRLEGQDVLTQVPQWASGVKFDGDQNVSELPWKTIYTPETLSVDAVTLDLLHAASQP